MGRENSFRNGIIAAIIFFLVAVIGFVIYTATLSFGLVSKNYYAEEIAYQQQIERIERTRVLPEQVRVTWDDQKGVTVKFPACFEPAAVSSILVLYRPSDSRLDRHYPLNLDRAGRQYVATNKLPLPGLWKIKIYWEAEGLEYYQEKEIIR